MWQRLAVNWLGLPADVVLDLPQIVWTGALEVSVHNHRGLAFYSDARVVVRSSIGPVRIDGADLAVRQVSADRVQVAGRVRAVRVGA